VYDYTFSTVTTSFRGARVSTFPTYTLSIRRAKIATWQCDTRQHGTEKLQLSKVSAGSTANLQQQWFKKIIDVGQQQ